MSKQQAILSKLGLVVIVFVLGYGLAELPNLLDRHNETVEIESLCHMTTSECRWDATSAVLAQDVVKAMQPTTITATWPNTDADRIRVSLKGVEMEMGEPRFVLNRTQANTFTGDLLLPVCTSDAMTWVGEINDGHSSHTFKLSMER
ncbi:hypothetical protein [Vibrio sp. qd031]|uniref:hypothetical protein n=1 Tax=Vibrio sp. qd031 TaxID=1603038 RepID=UPI000A111BF1|nr:hypothetical protein [Vibrio sp. qd031]